VTCPPKPASQLKSHKKVTTMYKSIKKSGAEISKSSAGLETGWGKVHRVAKYMKPTEFVVYATLLSYQGHKEYCYPTVATLAKECGLSPSTIMKATAALEASGWLYKEFQSNSSVKYFVYRPNE